MPIYLTNLTDISIYTIIISIVILALVIGLIIYLLVKNRKTATHHIDTVDTNDLLKALGTLDNINHIELVQKRLQIEVKNVKAIDQTLLKQLDIPAFLTGKKITLLIKDNAKTVYSNLNEKRKEEV